MILSLRSQAAAAGEFFSLRAQTTVQETLHRPLKGTYKDMASRGEARRATPIFSYRCRECLPEEWFCGDCDVLRHKKQPLHNRERVIHGFFEANPPTSCVIKGQDGYCIREKAAFKLGL
ncbi:hypothetical protein IRJ41_003852 [Triplophysa rosa]|uniref:Uncharacterized protein n=1 Tax=Triplophysa rosa TaxID=992332 RepID=A0A9W7X140_TRIRA|nr:hypothetical protein IRJ41_003852 [Triplophysa rosa]